LITYGNVDLLAPTMIDSLDGRPMPLERELRRLARRQTSWRALVASYGMASQHVTVELSELGDVGHLSVRTDGPDRNDWLRGSLLGHKIPWSDVSGRRR
jgi:hypothetical protein